MANIVDLIWVHSIFNVSLLLAYGVHWAVVITTVDILIIVALLVALVDEAGTHTDEFCLHVDEKPCFGHTVTVAGVHIMFNVSHGCDLPSVIIGLFGSDAVGSKCVHVESFAMFVSWYVLLYFVPKQSIEYCYNHDDDRTCSILLTWSYFKQVAVIVSGQWKRTVTSWAA